MKQRLPSVMVSLVVFLALVGCGSGVTTDAAADQAAADQAAADQAMEAETKSDTATNTEEQTSASSAQISEQSETTETVASEDADAEASDTAAAEAVMEVSTRPQFFNVYADW